jgi:hypothetical protein
MRYFGDPAVSQRPVGFPSHSCEWFSIVVYLWLFNFWIQYLSHTRKRSKYLLRLKIRLTMLQVKDSTKRAPLLAHHFS